MFVNGVIAAKTWVATIIERDCVQLGSMNHFVLKGTTTRGALERAKQSLHNAANTSNAFMHRMHVALIMHIQIQQYPPSVYLHEFEYLPVQCS